jgi:hypothetical protein
MFSVHRIHFILRILLAVVLAAAIVVPDSSLPVQAASCNVSGAISTDTIWSPAACDPYIVSGNIVVMSGVTLTITPGTRVLFNASKAIQIGGTLVARGSAASPIRFSANASTIPGFWGYILFVDSSIDASYDLAGNYLSGSIIQYATVEYGGGLNVADNGMIRMDSASPLIDHVTVQKSASDGTHAFNTAHPYILNSTIRNNTGSGIYQNNTAANTFEIGGNIIENNQYSGIFLDGTGKVNIHNNLIKGNYSQNQGGGIRMPAGIIDDSDNYYFMVTDNTIIGNTAQYFGGGIYVEYKGQSEGVMISGNFFSENSTSENVVGGGGGLYIQYMSRVIVSHNIFLRNSTNQTGGGINARDTSGSFDHNILVGNAARISGGGFFGGGNFTNNTVLSNSATTAAAVDYSWYNSTQVFNNNTILDNLSTGAAADNQSISLIGHPTLAHNNIVGNNGYALYNHNLEASGNVTATNNWWGTASAVAIQNQIYDWVADGTLSLVNYSPFLTTPDTGAPIAPPTNVQGVRASTSISLTWSANAESDLAGYKVYWGTGGYPYQHVQDVGNLTHYTIPDLEQGTNYQVAVTAYDDGITGANDQTNGNESWFTSVELTLISPTVTAITPASGLTDTAVPVTITGDNFAPTPTAYLNGYRLSSLTYQDPQTLKATVPAGLPVGVYALTVTNPDGKSDTLINAFEVKTGAPVLVQVLPGRGRSDQPNLLHLYGLNFTAGTTVKLGTAVPTALSVRYVSQTQLLASVPLGLTPGIYPLLLQNPHSDIASYPGAYEVLDAAQLDLSANAFGLWTDPVTLREEQTAQMGLVVHRESGNAPIPNVKVNFYNGDPTAGGTLIGSGTIPMLAADDSSTNAVNWSGVVEGSYTLYAVIDPDHVLSEADKANNTTSRQVIVLPPARDVIPPTVDSFSANGGAQQTTTPNISLNASISDPQPSSGVAAIMYIEYEYSQGAARWIPVKNTEWLPYSSSHSAYPWGLAPVAGLRYLQAWGADGAGNISRLPSDAYINYLPTSDDLVQGQMRLYRYHLKAGQQFTVTLTPTSGDADLYIWPAVGAPWKSDQLGTAVDIISFSVPSDGTYQVEVRGYSATTYSLQVNISGASTVVQGDAPSVVNTKPVPAVPMVAVGSQPGGQVGLPAAPTTGPYLYMYIPKVTR